jgi:hypothetical protein
VLLVVCAGDAVSPQQRPAVNVQTDHDELSVLETERRVTGGGESELRIRPVMYLEYPLRTYGRQDRYLPLT